MKIALEVTFNDGTKTPVDAVFADFVAFERTWSRSVARFETEIRLTDLAWLAWHSETRCRKTALKFDPDWINTVEDVAMREDEPTEVVDLPKENPKD
jgi:hypothetical protein